jgi:predicted transcriptional regulator
VLEALERDQPTGYTTVLKFLQIMTEKGLVRRDDAQRAHVYEPALEKGQVQQSLLGSLLDRAFSGSAARLVMQALSSRPSTPEELAAIRRLLDRLEGEQ